MNKLLLFLITCFISIPIYAQKKDHHLIEVKKTLQEVTIDGVANESFWEQTQWLDIDQLWMGGPYSAEDFSGRYKIRWNNEGILLLVEIVDDVIFDQYQDPFTLWWDDDCVEVFIDQDNSGGEHQYNHNAFAYHVAYDGRVIDIAPDKLPRDYSSHITAAHTKKETTYTWELFVKLYDDSFTDGVAAQSQPLYPNSKVGFALAYCDNDGSKERENFIGSVYVPGEDKNQGWINADIFSTLVLMN